MELRAAPVQGESSRCASDRSGSAGPAKKRLNKGAAALMREINEIGSGDRARQKRGVHQKSAPFLSNSALGFDLREEDALLTSFFLALPSARKWWAGESPSSCAVFFSELNSGFWVWSCGAWCLVAVFDPLDSILAGRPVPSPRLVWSFGLLARKIGS